MFNISGSIPRAIFLIGVGFGPLSVLTSSGIFAFVSWKKLLEEAAVTSIFLFAFSIVFAYFVGESITLFGRYAANKLLRKKLSRSRLRARSELHHLSDEIIRRFFSIDLRIDVSGAFLAICILLGVLAGGLSSFSSAFLTIEAAIVFFAAIIFTGAMALAVINDAVNGLNDLLPHIECEQKSPCNELNDGIDEGSEQPDAVVDEMRIVEADDTVSGHGCSDPP